MTTKQPIQPKVCFIKPPHEGYPYCLRSQKYSGYKIYWQNLLEVCQLPTNSEQAGRLAVHYPAWLTEEDVLQYESEVLEELQPGQLPSWEWLRLKSGLAAIKAAFRISRKADYDFYQELKTYLK